MKLKEQSRTTGSRFFFFAMAERRISWQLQLILIFVENKRKIGNIHAVSSL
jgi:hypothetical protein